MESLAALGLMLSAMFAVGSFWFWTLICVETCALYFFVEKEMPGRATTMLVLTGLFMRFVCHISVLGLAFDHPFYALLCIPLYLAVGTAWGVGRWKLFVSECTRSYNAIKAEFLSDKKVDGTKVPDELLKEWASFLVRSQYRYLAGINDVTRPQPRIRDHKARFMIWMCYWPISMSWTLLRDPIRRAFQEIYAYLSTYLQKMSDKAFAGTADDFREAPPPPPAPPAAPFTPFGRGNSNDPLAPSSGDSNGSSKSSTRGPDTVG